MITKVAQALGLAVVGAVIMFQTFVMYGFVR